MPVMLTSPGRLSCSKPAEPATPSEEGYGYENEEDPAAEAEGRVANRPTSCARVRCAAPRVCRLLSTSDPDGVARAYCVGPDDDLCRLDPEICR